MASDVLRPEQGRPFESYVEGEIKVHPRGLTVHACFAQEFACTFHDANPLHLNEPFASAHGFSRQLVPPVLALNIAFGLGVQHDSERAVAHLGWSDVRFFRPIYAGDTIHSLSKVLGKRDRGPGEPGIVHLRTAALNQRRELLLQYDRQVLIPRDPHAQAHAAASLDATDPLPGLAPARDFPLGADRTIRIPSCATPYPTGLTGDATYWEALREGTTILHPIGRTITDEHYAWAMRLGNTHPLHFDRLYTGRRGRARALPPHQAEPGGAPPSAERGGAPLPALAAPGPSPDRSAHDAGEPLVFGGLVLAWTLGLASRDTTENALFDLRYDQGYHPQPVYAGDTLAALSRIVHVGPPPPDLAALEVGTATFRVVGVKNVTAAEAWDRHGEALFVPEPARQREGRPKVPEKVFEIERTVLVKKRPRR